MDEQSNHPTAVTELGTRFVANVETVVRGKTDQVKVVLATLLCGGHVLLEDVPGTAKTVLARWPGPWRAPRTHASSARQTCSRPT
jgi:MoxR-like ATPase